MLETTSKKMKRFERKKKKLAALLEIVELNNKDRNEVLESTHLHKPSGEILDTMETANSKHIEEKEKVGPVSHNLKKLLGDESKTSEQESNESMDLEEGETQEDTVDISHRKHKKKRKKKFKPTPEDMNVDKVECELRTEETTKEEWPILGSPVYSDNRRQKRKSNFDDTIKERPEKMGKWQSGYSPNVPSTGSCSEFSDDLASLKKDIERKNKKLKKIEEEKNKKIALKIEEEKNKKIASENKTLTENEDQKSTLSGEEAPPGKINYAKELADIKTLLKDRRRQLKELPTLKLRGVVGKEANLSEPQRTPILPGDVQALLMLSQLGQDCPRFPRWLELKRINRISKTVVLIVEGASAYDFYSTESSCPTLSNMDVKVEMVSPYCYNAGVPEELCAVPITKQQKKTLEKKFGKEICPEALQTDRIIKVLRSAFSISSVCKTRIEDVEEKISVPSTDKFPRTALLLSVWQLIEEGYPLPYKGSDLGDRYPDYVMSKDEYKEVTPSSPMWGLDCEMCVTKLGNELTRVSVVDEQHKTVYESLCLPYNPIRDYVTEYSGITRETLKGVTTRLEDIQRDLKELFPDDVILVGHSLGNDLHALKMMHPYVIDTSVIYNLTGTRRHKSKLSKLALEFLNEAIQQRGAQGHDSVEDSLAALRLVQCKLTKSISYGDAVLSGFKDYDRSNDVELNSSYQEHSANELIDLQIEVGPTMATSLFKHITMKKNSVAVIGLEETLAEYSVFIAAAQREDKQLVKVLTTTSNAETINLTCRECKNNKFTLAHVVLSEEEDVLQVDQWIKRIFDSPPFNSVFIVVLAGSHNSFANGACFATVKKPHLKLKTRKTD